MANKIKGKPEKKIEKRIQYTGGKSVCIVCEKEKEGVPVKEDNIIKFIRSIKKRLGVAKGYSLDVCSDCWAKYEEKRKNYEKSMLTWLVIGAALIVIMLLLIILTGWINFVNMITTILMLAILLGIMIGLVFISRYVPKTEMTMEEWKGRKRK